MSCWRIRKSRPKERVGTNHDVGRDRLSERPDDVIIRILSFLPTCDAVRTVLLRRFGNLWTLVPSINLDIFEFFGRKDEMGLEPDDDVGRFFLFGRNVLKLNRCFSIDKLCLHVDSYCDDGSIPMWLRFSLDRQAKEIRYCDTSDDVFFTRPFLPNLISEYLITLELDGCRLDMKHQFNLGSLKKLKLVNVAMYEEDTFQRLLSGCPSLQELSITDPRDIDELTFSAPNIHTLSLCLDYDIHSWSLIFPTLKA